MTFSYCSILDQECWAIQTACCWALLPQPSIQNKRWSIPPPPGPVSLEGGGGYHWTPATFVPKIYKVKKSDHISLSNLVWNVLYWAFCKGCAWFLTSQDSIHQFWLWKQNLNFYNGLRLFQDADMETHFCRLGCQTEGNCHCSCKETGNRWRLLSRMLCSR